MTVLRKAKMVKDSDGGDIAKIARFLIDLLHDHECSPEQSAEVVKYLDKILEKG
jgi:hypothetical protein